MKRKTSKIATHALISIVFIICEHTQFANAEEISAKTLTNSAYNSSAIPVSASSFTPISQTITTNNTSTTGTNTTETNNTSTTQWPTTITQAYSKLQSIYTSVGYQPSSSGECTKDIVNQTNNTTTRIERDEQISQGTGGIVFEGTSTRTIGGSTQSSNQIQTYYDAKGAITGYAYYEFLGFGTDKDGNRTSKSISISYDASGNQTSGMLYTTTTFKDTGRSNETREYLDANNQKKYDTLQGSNLEETLFDLTGVHTEQTTPQPTSNTTSAETDPETTVETDTTTSLETYSNSTTLLEDFSNSEPYYMRINYYSDSETGSNSESKLVPSSIFQILEDSTDATGNKYCKEEISSYDTTGNLTKVEYIAEAWNTTSYARDTYVESYNAAGLKTKDQWDKTIYENGSATYYYTKTNTYDETGKKTGTTVNENPSSTSTTSSTTTSLFGQDTATTVTPTAATTASSETDQSTSTPTATVSTAVGTHQDTETALSQTTENQNVTIADSPYLSFVETASSASTEDYDYLGNYQKTDDEVVYDGGGKNEQVVIEGHWTRTGQDTYGNQVTEIKTADGDTQITTKTGTTDNGCVYDCEWDVSGYKKYEYVKHNFYINGVKYQFYYMKNYDAQGNVTYEKHWGTST